MLIFCFCRVASPAMDLLYFFFTSPQPDILSEKFFDLVKMYHEAFASDARKLGIDCSKFTLEKLHQELKERAFFTIVILSTITPIIVAKPSNAVNMDDFDPEKKETPGLSNNYKDEYYMEILQKHFQFLEKLGYFKEIEERSALLEEFILSKKAEAPAIHQNNPETNLPSAPTEILANSS